MDVNMIKADALADLGSLAHDTAVLYLIHVNLF